jgi:DEAD/DEAH box helicase domain-containing protein
MSIETALRGLQNDVRFHSNVVEWRQLPARPAHVADYPPGLHPVLAAALATGGLTSLYSHQADAVAAALHGRHVAVVTPAASGKTLCYNLPVLHHLLADPAARALYLFPTKALAQDQLATLNELLDMAEPLAGRTLRPATYDGDTPSGQRARIRDGSRIILSNPDMLHSGILPQHPRWAGFFANLRLVVVDEMHVYRGVFGSHVANVLRRLRRICRFHGNVPQFILASATIANPADLAARLVAAPVTVIGPERNGAPQGARDVLLYNPPVLDPALGIRRSSSLEATDLAAHLLDHGVQTIVFAGARLTTELILADLQARPQGGSRVRGYRGGYLPRERREIERGLRSGAVRGVVATNALELGIDIGQLEASLLSSYPGTIASTWQQIGRAGRRQGRALAVLVATPGPLDQYLMAHPEYLFDQSPERALINPDNPTILAGHLECAAAEIPFEADEQFGDARDCATTLQFLAEAGELYNRDGRFYWAGEGNPAAAISLRTGSPDRVLIQCLDERGQPQVIGEVDRPSVPLLVYEGAVYLHGGETYLVEQLDWEAGVATVRPAQLDYYTRPSLNAEVEVVDERESRRWPGEQGSEPASAGLHLAWGDVRVVTRCSGYKVLSRQTHEVLGFGTLEMPEQVLETAACWLALTPALVENLKDAGVWLSDPNEYGPQWDARRAEVRMRDGFRCQACGLPEQPGKQHHVHHRIPFRAFLADPSLRPGLAPTQAWQVANRTENLITLCPSCHHRAEASVRIASGLGGLAALLMGIAPLHLMCDPRDLGMAVEAQAPGSGMATITVYEKVPAGIGYAAELYALMPGLLRAAYDLVRRCLCENGCPSCVGPVLEHEYALDTKALTRAILDRLCE